MPLGGALWVRSGHMRYMETPSDYMLYVYLVRMYITP